MLLARKTHQLDLLFADKAEVFGIGLALQFHSISEESGEHRLHFRSPSLDQEIISEEGWWEECIYVGVSNRM